MDGLGTINPAELESLIAFHQAHPLDKSSLNVASRQATGPRGVKRTRSPEKYGGKEDVNNTTANTISSSLEDSRSRKRGKVVKELKSSVPAPVDSESMSQTPQPAAQSLPPRGSPTQASPVAKSTPNSKNVKALPTVRDHTTDELNPEGDEYIWREEDEAGNEKVMKTGHLKGRREYKCRTFFVPNRGDKLFMLATECARNLNYRDSYLLFNKNKSLKKIIASQTEKDDLIQQEILPYSYRSRQIAIVTALSMFRQFGARIIVNGRRVRDDYWETKARKQGFTEDDLAGEKRPGATKPAAQQAPPEMSGAGASAMNVLAARRIEYTNNGPDSLLAGVQPGLVSAGGLATVSSLPMIDPTAMDGSARGFGNVSRPRQEITGNPYEDRTQSNQIGDIVTQAVQVSAFNTQLHQERTHRSNYLTNEWNREHPIQPIGEGNPSPIQDVVGLPPQSRQSFHSPTQMRPHGGMSPAQIMAQQQNHTPVQAMGIPQAQQYNRPTPQPALQSPLQNMHQQSQQIAVSQQQQQQQHQQQHRGSISGYNPYVQGGQIPANAMYAYQNPSAMWAGPSQQHQPQPQHHASPMPTQQSPYHQQSPHPHQSPHQPPQQQLPPQQQMAQQQAMPYGGGMGGVSMAQYQQGMRSMYAQANPQYMHHQSSAGQQQPGLPGWASNTTMPGQPSQMGPGQQGGGQWPTYG